jgi:hypothetical protein
MQRRLVLLDAFSNGERAMLDKKILTHAQARVRMSKWLK